MPTPMLLFSRIRNPAARAGQAPPSTRMALMIRLVDRLFMRPRLDNHCVERALRKAAAFAQFFKAESRLRYPGSLGYSLFLWARALARISPDPQLRRNTTPA